MKHQILSTSERSRGTSSAWPLPWATLLLPVVVTALLAACSSDDAVEVREAYPFRCMPESLADEFAALTAESSEPVTWNRIRNAAAIPHVRADVGGSFRARDGDYIMANDRVRAIVQQPSRQWWVTNYGGTLIGADLVREDGVWHNYLGQMSPFIGLSYTVNVQGFEVVRDGGDGVLVIGAHGPVVLLDYLNVPGAISVVSAGLTGGDPLLSVNVPWDMDKGIPLHASYYYVLKSGEARIAMHTAICNPTESAVTTCLADLIDAGGNVAGFDTESRVGGEPGFGLGLTLGGLTSPAGTFGYLGDTSGYAIRPRMPASILPYGQVGILLHGTGNVLDFLVKALFGFDTAEDATEPPPGYFLLEPYEAMTVSRDLLVFEDYRDLRSQLNAMDGVAETARIGGTLRVGGQPFGGGRVAVLSLRNRLETILKADDRGVYAGTVRPGLYALHVEPDGGPAPNPRSVLAVGGGESTVDFDLEAAAELRFDISGIDPHISGQPIPMPAKVSLVCVGPCPRPHTRLFRDTLYDRWPDDLQTQAVVDHEGRVSVMAKRGRVRMDTLAVPAGTYDLVLTRGQSFSRHLERVTLGAGEHRTIQATLDRVVEAPGYIAADTHVHMIHSFDCPVPEVERVLTFAGEGVEVLVATDHDHITDLGPTIAGLGLGAYVTSIPGEEMTLFDIGHFNAYPLRHDPDAVQGGAFDPGGSPLEPRLSPAEMFSGMRDLGSFQDSLVQVNHPRSLIFGYFSAIQLDTDTLETHADPATFRMDPRRVAATGGLYSSDYDTFEVYNSYGELNAGLNDLFAFLNIGENKVGVAVSDTHHWYASAAGSPRSHVYVGTDHHRAETFDPEVFARAMKQGRVIGSNGPFVEMRLRCVEEGLEAGLGEMLSTSGPVRVEVSATMPEWITIDTLEVFSNTPDVAVKRGRSNNRYPTPQFSRRVAATDFLHEGGAKTVVWTFETTPPRDAWFVAVARDDADYGDNHPMFPAIFDRRELPFAFTNAVFVDANLSGRFDPPGPQGQTRTGQGVALSSLAPAEADAEAVAAARRAYVLELLEWTSRSH